VKQGKERIQYESQDRQPPTPLPVNQTHDSQYRADGRTSSANVTIRSADVDMPAKTDSETVQKIRKITDSPNRMREIVAKLRFTFAP
jgi:hypothetical protein